MEKVVSLYGGPTGVAEPNELCIAALEDALEKARSGEVIGVSIIRLHRDGCASWINGGFIGGFSFLGAVNMVAAELIKINRENC